MGNLSRCLLFFFVLATIFPAHASQAVEDVYLKGDKGHFRLEPGKVYHWDWTGIEEVAPKKTGLPEKFAVNEPPAEVVTAPATVKPSPEAVETGARVSEGEAHAITKEAVAMMISKIEKAANRKDINGIADYLSPELVVLLTTESPTGRQDLRLNKKEYLDKLQQRFSSPQYHYKSYNFEIIMSQDGKSATIVEDIRETVGAKTDVVYNQKSAIELRGGQIVVTKIVSTQK